ncbi:MAG TPA: SoxR reducing system RseC family protein [Firmicutes bacterium]|nr:SoxR reducing system RseC family protein [Bacillota bacterium]
MRRLGEIVKIEGNQAWVKFANPSEACGSCKGCIRLTMQEQEDERVFKLALNIKAEVGDTIMVEYPEKGIVQTMLVLYGLPFLGLFLGYFLTSYFTGSETTSALTALGGLIVCGILARPVARLVDEKIGQPRIVSTACQSQ